MKRKLPCKPSTLVITTHGCFSPAPTRSCAKEDRMTPARPRPRRSISPGRMSSCSTRRRRCDSSRDRSHAQPSSHVSPRSASTPSFAMIGTMISAATGSAHHQPASALSSRPPRRIAESARRYRHREGPRPDPRQRSRARESLQCRGSRPRLDEGAEDVLPVRQVRLHDGREVAVLSGVSAQEGAGGGRVVTPCCFIVTVAFRSRSFSMVTDRPEVFAGDDQSDKGEKEEDSRRDFIGT